MRPVTIVSLLVFIAAVYLIMTASPLLEYELSSDPDIPLGNILTWTGIIALPVAVYTGISSLRNPESTFNNILKILLLIAIALAILWMPVSYYLADNLAANFEAQEGFRGSTRASNYFWNYTYFVVGLPLLILFSFWILRLTILIKRSF